MNLLEFELLCRDASVELGMADTGALGQGSCVSIADVLFEAVFREGSDDFMLMAEVGPVTAPSKASVYESLLMTQLITWDRPGLRFGFNPERGTIVLCVQAGGTPHRCGSWLASVMRSVAAQVVQWRNTLLAGHTPVQETPIQGSLAPATPDTAGVSADRRVADPLVQRP
jgi:hypothetical protein